VSERRPQVRRRHPLVGPQRRGLDRQALDLQPTVEQLAEGDRPGGDVAALVDLDDEPVQLPFGLPFRPVDRPLDVVLASVGDERPT
jgi:hypothetical protein